MNRRLFLVGAAVGLFAAFAIDPMPAAATPTPSRPSRAGPSSNRPRPTLPPPSERRMTSSRGPITPTPDENGILPPSSPVSDPSPISPVSSSAPGAVAEMNRQINNQIDDAIEYFSAASESSEDRGEMEREERGMWFE